MHRWGRTAVAATATGLALAGCGSPDAGGAAGGAPADEVLRVVGPFEVHSLEPATAGGIFTRMQVAETLVEADGEGVLEPGLSTAWTAGPDGLAWTFDLREGAQFHDGSPVTAEAVAASLRAALDDESPLADAPVRAVTADGDAVRFELAEPFAPLPAVLAHTSTQVLAPSSYRADGAVTQVVGSGPYRVERVQQPSSVDVVAFDGWHEGAPAVERVRYEAVGRAESRALLAQSGQAHVVLGMDPVALQRAKRSRGAEVVSVTLPRTIQLKVDAGEPPFDDVRVRQALSLALDRQAMATALLRDPEMAADQLFPPSLREWHSDDVEPLRHDADAARALLAEAGWEPGADGVLTRDGGRLAVQLRTFPDRPELPPLATAVQDALRSVGIAVDVSIGNSSEIPAGHQDGSLDLGLYARNFALVPDPLVTLRGDFAPEGSDWGAMGWSDQRLTSTLAGLARGEDTAEGRRAVAALLQDELPVVPVAWYRQSAVVSDRVEGFALDPLERSFRLSDLRWA